jgi:hypothetical protein
MPRGAYPLPLRCDLYAHEMLGQDAPVRLYNTASVRVGIEDVHLPEKGTDSRFLSYFQRVSRLFDQIGSG